MGCSMSPASSSSSEGAKGATVLARSGAERLRFEVATAPIDAADTTGAGDAFDAGFLVGWFAAKAAGRALPAALHRATLSGHRVAARQLSHAASGARNRIIGSGGVRLGPRRESVPRQHHVTRSDH